MKIEHVAIWVRDLEKMKSFYEQYFDGKSNDKYYNATKGFESYFITFKDGARLEVMRQTGVDHSPQINTTGWAHVAFSVGSKELVNEKTEQLMHAGYEVVGQPRLTGDGYYESVIKDPEGNLIEISM